MLCYLVRIMATRSVSTISSPSLVAVLQMTSTNDRERNYEVCRDLITKAAKHNIKMAFLPECFDFISSNREECVALYCTEDSTYINRYRDLAKQLNIWICLGGFHEKGPESDPQKRSYNTQLLIDCEGRTAAKYRKLHLFDVDIPGKVKLTESDTMLGGSSLVPPCDTPIGKIGLATCYDVRFPQLSLWLRERGAQILTYPSAFTVHTGLAHWHTLLRARAIETQSYVCAPAQTGVHNPKRTSYGHAVVVDPWGEIVAACSEGNGYCLAQIDLDYVKTVRTNLPCYNHRRSDLYQLYSPVTILQDPNCGPSVYAFGDNKITPSIVFCRSPLSYAFVNRKPVVTGHVLIAPIRPVPKLSDLGPAELYDLFSVVHMVQKELEVYFQATSSTISIQDGPDAGQTVNHVHVHILPRKKADFAENDVIYRELAEHDKVANKTFRSLESMAEEAEQYRPLFIRKTF